MLGLRFQICKSKFSKHFIAPPASIFVQTNPNNQIRFKSKKFQKETKELDVKTVLATPQEIEAKTKLATAIPITEQRGYLGHISSIPEIHLKTRCARIYKSAKNAMQSGTNNVNHWKIEFETRNRWENPLMGWTSTGDPLSNMELKFSSEREAIDYCERNDLKWFVQKTPAGRKEQRVKNYGINFAHDKRTRVQTK